MKFYKCAHCGKIVTELKEAKVPTMCCGEAMKEIIPGTVDAAVEKHVPVVTTEGGVVTVKVGSVTHPMTPEHLIEWIAVETKFGFYVRKLTATDAPEATFTLASGDEVVAVYEYCNLHSLWKA
jgi:superoxide reductase